jgi:hypothetical protein
LGILLTQQLQRHADAFEFLVHSSEVGWQLVTTPGKRWFVQPRYEFFIAQGLGNQPIDSGGAGKRCIFGGGTLGYLEGAANCAKAQVCPQVQAQGLSNLTHGDSVRWHGLSAS